MARKPLDPHTLRCAAAYVMRRSWSYETEARAGVKSAVRMLRTLATEHESKKSRRAKK